MGKSETYFIIVRGRRVAGPMKWDDVELELQKNKYHDPSGNFVQMERVTVHKDKSIK